MKKIIILTTLVLSLLLSFGGVMIVKYYKDIAETGLKDKLPYGWGKDATVILLAGQSNAAGCSRDDYLRKNVSAEKYKEYEDGYDNVYINYFASGTNQSRAFVKCSVRQGEGFEPGFFGPELGLAEKLNDLYPDRTFFIIKYAWGGTNLYEQWLSPSAGEVGPLYQNFVEYVRSSISYLETKNYNVNLEAMCWMQGEADSIDEENTNKYEMNLSCFITDIRSEFSDYASNNGIAFVDAYISSSFFWKHYIQINQAKKAVADSSPMNVVIDTISYGLSITEEPENEPDLYHYDSLSEIKLGHLFAEEIAHFFD